MSLEYRFYVTSTESSTSTIHFGNLHGEGLHKKLDKNVRIEIWKPSLFSWFPHYRHPLRSILWVLFEFTGMIERGVYGAIRVFVDDRLVHQSGIFPGMTRFSFMRPGDIQVGNTWTDPDMRGKGLAKLALEYGLEYFKDNKKRLIWYVVQAENIPSIKVAESCGMKWCGLGDRLPRYGIDFLGRFFLFVRLYNLRDILSTHRERDAQEEKEHYSELYGDGRNFSDEFVRKVLLNESEDIFCAEVLRRAPGSTAFEVGCGRGDHSLIAAKAGATVLGVDIAGPAIKEAQNAAAAAKLSDNAQFRTGDVIEILHASEGKYDLIIDHESISSFEFADILPAILRALKPEGSFVGIECLSENPIFRFNRWLGTKRGRRTMSANRNTMRSDYMRCCRSVFEESKVEVFHLFLPFSKIIMKLPIISKLPIKDIVNVLDRAVLKLPILRSLAFKTVFVFSKPRVEALQRIQALFNSSRSHETKSVVGE